MFGEEDVTYSPRKYTYQKRFERMKEFDRNIWTLSNYNYVIVGLGGLGYHITKLLAMTLYKFNVTLYDYDEYSEVNANRLDIPMEKVGLPKVIITKEEIERIRNRDITINAVVHKFICKKFDNTIIIDETDGNITQRDIYECAKKYGLPYLSMKYNGLDHGTLYWNAIPFVAKYDNGYERVPSLGSSAYYFAGYFVTNIILNYDKLNEKFIKTVTL